MSSSKAYFDDVGADWDGLREGFFSGRVRETAIEIAGLREGALAADLGAGTGFITEYLVERGARVIAVDQSPVMLRVLRTKLPAIAQVETRVGTAEDLPLDDRAVDYCFANMYLHHVDRPDRAIGEMARVLKPGGRAVITDLDAHEHEFLREEHHDRWMGFARDDVRRWFESAGFKDVRLGCVGERCCGTSSAEKAAAISIFIASGTR